MTNPLQALITKSNETTPNTVGQFDWAEVVSVNPLYLVLDSAQDDVVTGGIDNLVGHLTVGQRVRVHLHGGRVYIYGNPALMRRMVQHGTSGGVNGTWVETGASDNTSEPSWRLRRLRADGKDNYARLYLSNSSSTPEVALYAGESDGPSSTLYMRGDTGKLEMLSGVRRPLPFATASGGFSAGGTANTTFSTSITFPSGRFTTTPGIFIQLRTSNPQNGYIPSYTGESATGFTAHTRYATTTVMPYKWFAIQLEP